MPHDPHALHEIIRVARQLSISADEEVQDGSGGGGLGLAGEHWQLHGSRHALSRHGSMEVEA